MAAQILSRWLEPALLPDFSLSEQGVLRQHAAHPLVGQGDAADTCGHPVAGSAGREHVVGELLDAGQEFHDP